MSEFFTDQDLGTICIVRDARAKNVIARRRPEHIQLTVPTRFSMKQIQDVFEQLKPRLFKLKPKPLFKFSPNVKFKTCTFSLKLEVKPVQNYYMNLRDRVLSIACPMNTNFDDEKAQNTIGGMIEKAMRYEAKRFLSPKIEQLANTFRFKYTEFKINKSKTRWGSCSSKRSINLSYFCLLLPEYLIDFVILHELCHTIEMNHGPEFWKLLDNVTDGKAKLLTNELKTYTTSW